MRAIDTNVLVRLPVRDDPVQANAAENYIAEGAWVSHLAMAETTWVLDAIYGRTPAQIADAVEILLNHNRLSLQDHQVLANALTLFRTRPSLGFSDCLMLETARETGHTPIGTFDKNFAKVAGAQKIRV